MLSLGTPAPEFHLRDAADRYISLRDFEQYKLLVVLFICNHCPYVVNIKDEIVRIAHEYQKKGVGFVAISSNDVEKYPADSPAKMLQFAHENGFSFPYLHDSTQEIATAYQAACTPDIYVFDEERKLIYRGQFDDSRPGNNIKPSGSDLRRALDLGLEGRHIPPKEQKPSLGCNIKWKPGNAPTYYQG